MEWLLGLAVCFALPAGIVLLTVWIIRLNKADRKKRSQERYEKISALRKKGVTAPAVVLSVKNGNRRGPENGSQETLITFQVEVLPEGRPAFQKTFQDWVPGRGYRHHVDDVGRKIWVTYDLNDASQIVFEYYDEDRKHALGREDFNKLQKEYDAIRKTGDEAMAVILEIEDMGVESYMEREFLKNTTMRLKLEVHPGHGQPFQAETEGLFANGSLYKYQVGKKIYVKINPQDKTQVALVRSAEE